MSRRIIISRANRDALDRHLLQDLSEVEGLRPASSIRSGSRLLPMSWRRMVDALRHIRDGRIGWGFTDDKDPLELKLLKDELRWIFESLSGSLADQEESERAGREESEKEWRETEQAREASISVLDQLGGR
jgi:hypothetical protein